MKNEIFPSFTPSRKSPQWLPFGMPALPVMPPGGGDAADSARDTQQAQKPIPVVLDTDIGSDVDDTWALAYLLKCPELDLKMVLCCTADTHYRGRLAAKFLDVCGRADVPVGLGPRGDSCHEYQKPWIGDYDFSDYPGTIHEDGIQAFINMVHASEVPVTLIAAGALPNIQEALRRDPSIAGKVRFVGMHGSIDKGYGPEPSAEANVKVNVPAFRDVHKAPWLSFEITPLDTCGCIVLDGERYEKLKASDSPMVKALLENYRIWADLVTWMEVDYFEERSSVLFDTVAVYMAFAHDFLEMVEVPITVTEDGFTRRDPAGIPTQVALRWKDLEGFYDHLTERLLS